jgi:hypothetical protein
MDVLERIDGVVIGLLIGFDAGTPLVVFVGNPSETALPARSLCDLDAAAVDPAKPLIVGRIVDPAHRSRAVDILRDGEQVTVVGGERIELRCGKASIILEKDGSITIRGSQLTSQASGTNRIRGGAIHLN